MKRISLLTTIAVFLWMGTMAARLENEKTGLQGSNRKKQCNLER